MWGYNTNMGQFGGPMTPQMNMGGGPRGFSPWMQGIPNGFQPPNFANNMGEVFGGMPGGGGPMQFNMGSQPGKLPQGITPMTNMPGQVRPPMPGGANPPNFFPGFGGGKPGGGQGGILPWLLPQGQGGGSQWEPLPYKVPQGGGGQTREMEIPPHIAQLLGYTKPTNDIGRESPPSKGGNGWLNNMLRSNPYMGGSGGPSSGQYVGDMALRSSYPQINTLGSGNIAGFNPRMMGMGMGLGMGMGGGISPQQLQQLMGMFGGNPGGGMGNPNAPYSSNPNHMVYM